MSRSTRFATLTGIRNHSSSRSLFRDQPIRVPATRVLAPCVLCESRVMHRTRCGCCRATCTGHSCRPRRPALAIGFCITLFAAEMPENDVRSGIHPGGGFPPGTVVVFSMLAPWATVGYPHVDCTRDQVQSGCRYRGPVTQRTVEADICLPPRPSQGTAPCPPSRHLPPTPTSWRKER